MRRPNSVPPVELMLNFLPVDEHGEVDRTVQVSNPHQPLQFPDPGGFPGAGQVIAVPRVGETVTLRTRRWRGQTLSGENNEIWEVVQVHWHMSDISRMKATPTQVATIRVKPSALDR